MCSEQKRRGKQKGQLGGFEFRDDVFECTIGGEHEVGQGGVGHGTGDATPLQPRFDSLPFVAESV